MQKYRQHSTTARQRKKKSSSGLQLKVARSLSRHVAPQSKHTRHSLSHTRAIILRSYIYAIQSLARDRVILGGVYTARRSSSERRPISMPSGRNRRHLCILLVPGIGNAFRIYVLHTHPRLHAQDDTPIYFRPIPAECTFFFFKTGLCRPKLYF